MTYCIAASIDEGLILVSDSRTNAGIDNVSTHGKMHAFDTSIDRNIVLLSAGNLATTQAVLEQLHRDKIKEAEINLNNVESLFEAADYLGHVSVEKQKIIKVIKVSLHLTRRLVSLLLGRLVMNHLRLIWSMRKVIALPLPRIPPFCK